MALDGNPALPTLRGWLTALPRSLPCPLSLFLPHCGLDSEKPPLLPLKEEKTFQSSRGKLARRGRERSGDLLGGDFGGLTEEDARRTPSEEKGNEWAWQEVPRSVEWPPGGQSCHTDVYSSLLLAGASLTARLTLRDHGELFCLPSGANGRAGGGAFLSGLSDGKSPREIFQRKTSSSQKAKFAFFDRLNAISSDVDMCGEEAVCFPGPALFLPPPPPPKAITTHF